MDIKILAAISSRAWSLQILALIQAGYPARQAPLLAATSASRSAFKASLEHLVQLGILERNPGHGHPLRPEYLMTDFGKRAAQMANRVFASAKTDGEKQLLRRNWTVPVLAVTQGSQRFSHIRASLKCITDRALATTLRQLEDEAWLRRDIDTSQRLPFPTYHLINNGREIQKALML